MLQAMFFNETMCITDKLAQSRVPTSPGGKHKHDTETWRTWATTKSKGTLQKDKGEKHIDTT